MQRTLLRYATSLLRQQTPAKTGHAALASTATDIKLDVKIDESKGVAILTMDRPPANLLTPEWVHTFLSLLDKLEADKSVRGLIMASSVPKYWCGGFDLNIMYQPNRERLRLFWSVLQEMAIRINHTPLAVVGAVNGYTIGGGLILALSCDYKVLCTGDYRMGPLVGAAVGAAPPFWMNNLVLRLSGFHVADKAVQRAWAFTPEESLKYHLADDLVEPDKLLSTAQADMDKLLKLPDHSRIQAKTVMREPYVDELRRRRDDDLQAMVDKISSDETQAIMGEYVRKMKEHTLNK